MNIEDIHKYVKQPLLLDDSNKEELEQLIKAYPYFQTAHLLFIKNLHINKNIRYSDQLKVAAAYAGDRKKLFELIKLQGEEKKKVEQSKPVEEKDKSLDERISIAEVTLEKLRRYKKKKEEELKRSQEKSEEEKALSEQATERSEADDLLKFDYNAEEEKIEEQKNAAEKRKKEFKRLQHQLIDYLQTYNVDSVPDEKIDFSKIADPNKAKRQKKNLDLINNFLDKPAKIVPKKHPEETVEDISKDSIAENDLLSETLAHIYMRQKNYPKAIAIYEKLILKYPEKSTYFAEKISDIRKLANNS